LDLERTPVLAHVRVDRRLRDRAGIVVGLQRAVEDADFWSWPRRPSHREPYARGDWSWFLEVRWNGRGHVAGGWNDAPPHFDEVRDALFELVEQVAK
jgi:hypothetical protein